MGYKFHRPWYTVCVYYRGDDDPPRFGFIISNKISKLAVHRHRIRRLLNDEVRHSLKHFPNGVSIIFLVKPAIASVVTDDIQKDIQEFLQRTNLH